MFNVSGQDTAVWVRTVLVRPVRMLRIRESTGQPANPGWPWKWPLKWCVCVCVLVYLLFFTYWFSDSVCVVYTMETLSYGYNYTHHCGCSADVMQLQPLNSSGIEPDRAVLRFTKESELRRGMILGAGAFGTVYRVCLILWYCIMLSLSSPRLLHQ